MRTLFLLLTSFIVVGCHVPDPVNVTLDSRNFHHILRWSPGPNTPPGTLYNIEISHEKRRNKLQCRETVINVSQYMKNIYSDYTLQLWASLGNSSSSIIKLYSTPYMSTIIGPPSVHLSGCGDCLNVTISMPKAPSNLGYYYRSFHYDIQWKKERDEKIHNFRYTSASLLISRLQPGERYCVNAAPIISTNSNTLRSEWICELTSPAKSRGVGFLLGWSAGAILFGLCVLIIFTILVYTRFLCKALILPPKVLTLFLPAQHLSLEEPCLSVAEVLSTKASRSRGVPHHEQNPQQGEPKENTGYRQNSQHDDDDDDEEDQCESSDSQPSSGGQSSTTTVLLHCGFAERYARTEETSLSSVTLLQPQSDGVTITDCRRANTTPAESADKDTREEEVMKESNVRGLRNISLTSVTLKSMRPNSGSEAVQLCQPLLPLRPIDTHPEPQTEHHFLTTPHTPTFIPTLTSTMQEELAETSLSCSEEGEQSDGRPLGYLMSQQGRMETESDCLIEEEEYYSADYMAR